MDVKNNLNNDITYNNNNNNNNTYFYTFKKCLLRRTHPVEYSYTSSAGCLFVSR